MLLVAGVLSGIVAAVFELPDPTQTIVLPIRLAGEAVTFRLEPEALWLMGFGLTPAASRARLCLRQSWGRAAGCSAPR